MAHTGKPGEIFLSVIVPAFNTEDFIENTLAAVCDFFRARFPFEVMVVDDGSRDGTAAAAARFAVGSPCVKVERNDRNRGKGYSVRRGVAAAAGRICLLTDADLPVDLKRADDFISAIGEGYDIVIGSRYLGGAGGAERAALKRMSSRAFNLLVRIMFGMNFSDTQCGFKLMRADTAKKVFSACAINRFAFDVEALYHARRIGARVLETRVDCAPARVSRVRPVVDPLIMLKDVLLLRVRTLARRRAGVNAKA